MAAQAVIANNMANASTIGYRAERVDFDALLLKGDGFDSRQPTSEDVKDFDRSAGAMISTGRSLDIAIPGDQWMAVQAADGSEAYSRRGDLNVSASGVLETGDGFPVMGSGGHPSPCRRRRRSRSRPTARCRSFRKAATPRTRRSSTASSSSAPRDRRRSRVSTIWSTSRAAVCCRVTRKRPA
ncbi:flagellar hook-basal body complex protein [Sphingomonas panacisoli]|uniref:flagellar hook-basal body complex protein n=1 Tax=Sphingomonas panacisoli TaxID=1813879 RepID=UPI003B846998